MSWLAARLVDDWRRCWRWFSVQLNGFALAWMGLYAVMPALDPSIAAVLPSPFQKPVIAAYAALGIVARLVAQKRA